MEDLRLYLQESGASGLAIGGLLVGLVFGFVVQRTNFCTMGSISDIHSFGDYRRFRAWLLAAAVAVIGSQIAQSLGAVNLNSSMYLSANLNWLGHIIGGLMFGFGMVFAGGCASRNLVRVGGGDMRSLVVLLVMGIVGYMTIGGLFGPARVAAFDDLAIDLAGVSMTSQGADAALASITGIAGETARWIMTALIAGGLIVYCFANAQFRSSATNIAAGVLIGLCVTAGWVLTGLAVDEFNPVAPISLTFVRPTGDTIDWLQRFTAGMVPSFGVATVLGCLAGAFLAAILSGRFQLTGFSDKTDTMRNLFGASLMGVGGVVALGCTVGQAVTGTATLAIGSMVTFAAIVIGGFIGIRYLEHLLMAD